MTELIDIKSSYMKCWEKMSLSDVFIVRSRRLQYYYYISSDTCAKSPSYKRIFHCRIIAKNIIFGQLKAVLHMKCNGSCEHGKKRRSFGS